MVIAVSPPDQGRLTVQKISDYRLHLAASDAYLAAAPPLAGPGDLRAQRIIGYIPDMIFDRELDYLSELGVEAPVLASNSVSVQLQLIRQGAGMGVVHDFALPATPGVRRVLTGEFGLTRAFTWSAMPMIAPSRASTVSPRRSFSICERRSRGSRPPPGTPDA
jgi:DNA-binding transcriptional LysR family regulator